MSIPSQQTCSPEPKIRVRVPGVHQNSGRREVHDEHWSVVDTRIRMELHDEVLDVSSGAAVDDPHSRMEIVLEPARCTHSIST